ncbi:DUF4215 domain-containing protein [Nannocystis radixulma]|uniref:DUF4215 domain-containing protein n=1 Tax=Nannocystis radixulma TaxID=2995305 RepID=A0ABT5BJW8_9BACT|nr:DUF4215 domain-containing protein [Nannocystis radixulma]MDC0674449.1 DUF4215 domain-containing protein [Nannocystis radixulma]
MMKTQVSAAGGRCLIVAAFGVLPLGCGDDGTTSATTTEAGSTTAGTTTSSSSASTSDTPTTGTPTSTDATTTSATTEATTEATATTDGATSSTTTDAATGTTSDATTETTTHGTTTGSTTDMAGVCGDGKVDDGEECDNGAQNGDDGFCTDACVNNVCGDGLVIAGFEACDDGNDVDTDYCSNACATGKIVVGGSFYPKMPLILDPLGVAYETEDKMWIAPNSAGLIILSDEGGMDPPPDYGPHFAAGLHLLIIGGASAPSFKTFLDGHFACTQAMWHQSGDCNDDWKTGPAHPITAKMPATYEFEWAPVSGHNVHFHDLGQPADVKLLGSTCHNGADNHVLVTRKYPGGGTFTYMAFHLGDWLDTPSLMEFAQPFLRGYLDWLAQGAP